MNTFIDQKAQEIGFALLRVAAYVRRFELKKKLETLSYHLIENISYKNFELAVLTVGSIKSFVRLAESMYEIEPVNARILNSELSVLDSELKRSIGIEDTLKIETIFSSGDLKLGRGVEAPAPKRKPAIKREIGNINQGNRKQEILSTISNSETGSMQFGDIADKFPNVSQRTIRNDLKSLSETGEVSRQGGGPTSSYSISQNTANIPRNELKSQELPSVINL